MANNQINKLLEFANMQMAAEAFLQQSADNGVLPGDAAIAPNRVGPVHCTEFVE